MVCSVQALPESGKVDKQGAKVAHSWPASAKMLLQTLSTSLQTLVGFNTHLVEPFTHLVEPARNPASIPPFLGAISPRFALNFGPVWTLGLLGANRARARANSGHGRLIGRKWSMLTERRHVRPKFDPFRATICRNCSTST